MAWMPLITKKTGISYSIVFVLAGMDLFSSLEPFLPLPNPLRDLEATHRLTELVVYSATELLYGYGFIAVFVAAVTLRNQELHHQLHETLHDFIDQIERILVAIVLLLLGGSIVEHILKSLNWMAVLFCLIFVLLIRPLTTLISLIGTELTKPQKTAIAFFGIKGIGSFYYLAFALSVEQFNNPDTLWSITASVVLFSIVIHGLTANIIMQNIK